MNKRANVSRETSGRAIQRALNAHIETHGEKLPQLLLTTFRTYNERFFDNLLETPCVLVTNPASPRALGDYCARDEHGLESRIRIRPNLTKRGLRYLEHVLLHEMVHAWVWEIQRERERSYRGHGPLFTAKANEISKALDLDLLDVAPKGRHKKPDAAQWPMSAFETEEAAHNYYGWAPKERVKRKPEALAVTLATAVKKHKRPLSREAIADALDATLAALADATNDDLYLAHDAQNAVTRFRKARKILL